MGQSSLTSSRSVGSPASGDPVRVGRHNSLIFIGIQLLIYFSAPVIYVGVVQAAFCDRLGASAMVANLPSSASLLGAVVPIFCCWLFATRFERAVLAYSFWIVGASMLFVCGVVFLPFSATWRIAVLIAQSFVVGIIANVTSVYAMTCLARGTTAVERAWALKYAFGFGPVAAVLGSFTAQLLLDDGVPGVVYPYNFGLLYLIAFPCMVICALLSSRFKLQDVPSETREPLLKYFRVTITDTWRNRNMLLAWLAYLFWYVTIDASPNISLFAREAVGRNPIELAGIVMAISFGCKALAGFALGAVAMKFGERATMFATVFLAGLALAWPLLPLGYGYLLAFGFMGGAELGGVYFPNYVLAISGAGLAARNLAVQSLVGPVSSVAPPLYGAITDFFGFRCSFVFGIMAALISCLLLLRLKRPASERPRAAAG